MNHSSTRDTKEPVRTVAPAESDTGKRREIIDGARRVFFDKGFDGASMDGIARASGVSKATIYTYFPSKDALFQALVAVDHHQSAERLFEADSDDSDPERMLMRIGLSFMTMMVRPDHIRLVRMVIGAAEKFPAVGHTFFDGGPSEGKRRLAELLARQVERGYLAVDDCDMAACQFINLCQGTLVKRLLFTTDGPVTPNEVETTVAGAVRVFLAAYGVRS